MATARSIQTFTPLLPMQDSSLRVVLYYADKLYLWYCHSFGGDNFFRVWKLVPAPAIKECGK